VASSRPCTSATPPCRSTPRSLALLGAHKHHSEPNRTTRTTSARARRLLAILAALPLHDTPDRRSLELELDLIGDAKRDGLFAQIGDGAEHATRRDDLVAALDRRQHPLALLLLLLLRPDHEEVEDGEHRAEHHERGHQLRRAAGTTARRGRHRPRNIGEEKAHRHVRIPDSPVKTEHGTPRTRARRWPRASPP